MPQSWRVSALFHLHSSPRKCEVLSWGYDRDTASGKRDIFATTLLCLLLVATAFAVNGFTTPVQLVSVRTELCETRDTKLADNLERMRNVTGHDAALEASSDRVNLASEAFSFANDTYNALGTDYMWPGPFELSESERQDLETKALEGGEDCEPFCLDGVGGFFAGFFGDKCKDVPCPDIESIELLMQYDASQQALDLSGDPVTIDKSLYEAEIDTMLNQATSAISVLVERINLASSCYVLYLAFLVIFPAPFVVYRANWKHACYDVLATMNKPMWISIVVVVWYAQGAFRSILNSSLYRLLWANFVKDPCWADPSFLVETASAISQMCVNVTSAHNLFRQAGNNYRYYEAVENTWEAASPDEGPFYDEPDDALAGEYPGNCSSAVLLQEIQPSDGNVDWCPLLWNSGALAALFLQFVLANWFISWFTLLRPLVVCRGKIMLPCEDNGSRAGNGDNQDPTPGDRQRSAMHDEVRGFIRMRAVLPLLIHWVLLALMLVNLYRVKRDDHVDRAVTISASVFSVFIILGTPALLFRFSDENSDVVASEGRPSSIENGGADHAASH